MAERCLQRQRVACRAAALGVVAAAFAVLPAKAQQSAAPSLSRRTEIISIDNWRVTCQDGETVGAKRSCSAELQIVQAMPNQPPRTIFTWIMGMREGKPVSVLQMPTGVLIGPGVEMKLGARPPRKFAFSLCQPGFCEAAVPLDDALIREISSAEALEVTIFAVDGRGVKFSIQPKGFDRALAEVRK